MHINAEWLNLIRVRGHFELAFAVLPDFVYWPAVYGGDTSDLQTDGWINV